MKFLMKNRGMQGTLESGVADDFVGLYLKSYDPEAYEGRGDATWTNDPTDAFHFESLAELLDVWHTVPESRPVRDDGRPNKPLTSVNIEVIRIE